MANYIIGMKQDLVFAYCESYGDNCDIQCIALESIRSIDFDYTDFFLQKIGE